MRARRLVARNDAVVERAQRVRHRHEGRCVLRARPQLQRSHASRPRLRRGRARARRYRGLRCRCGRDQQRQHESYGGRGRSPHLRRRTCHRPPVQYEQGTRLRAARHRLRLRPVAHRRGGLLEDHVGPWFPPRYVRPVRDSAFLPQSGMGRAEGHSRQRARKEPRRAHRMLRTLRRQREFDPFAVLYHGDTIIACVRHDLLKRFQRFIRE